MGGPIGNDLAWKIAKKLKAIDETEPNDVHDIQVVYFRGRMEAHFGIRRMSKKDKGHGHIPGDLRVSEHFAKDLGYCPKSRLDWLKKVGLLPEDAQNEDDPPAPK